MALQRQKRSSDSSENGCPPLVACQWSGKFPTLAEFISLTRWPEGETRVTGTVTFLFEGGKVKAALNDRDAELGAFVSAETFTALFLAMENGLASNSLDWRAKTASGPPKGGKRA